MSDDKAAAGGERTRARGPAAQPGAPRDRVRGARIKMLAILAVCAAPVIASYLTYYLIQPEGRTNYGTLIEPQRPVGDVALDGLDAGPFSLARLHGKWVMLTVDSGACARSCEDKLYAMRQVRLTAGKDRDRIERVMLVDDSVRPAQRIARDYEGMVFARIAPGTAREVFPAAPGGLASDHIFIVDPLGNLMMRYPRGADPNRIKKDVSKLLRASRVG